MDARTLQGRIARVEEKREFLEQLQANPNLGTLSLDVEQALIELEDLMAEFRQVFPDGVVREPIDRV
jgi:CTP-dependent riboflavin kinase